MWPVGRSPGGPGARAVPALGGGVVSDGEAGSPDMGAEPVSRKFTSTEEATRHGVRVGLWMRAEAK